MKEFGPSIFGLNSFRAFMHAAISSSYCIFIYFINYLIYLSFKFYLNIIHTYMICWGLGIGDWGLGIGDWGLGPMANHQSQSPLSNLFYIVFFIKLNKILFVII